MDYKKTVLPHIFALIIFVLISYIYFSPAIEGKSLSGHDNKAYKGMSNEIDTYRKETGEEPLWTNSLFGGMPAYFISVHKPSYISYIDRIFKFPPRPVEFLFLYLIGFYILLMCFRVNPWVGIIGSIAFAFSSYFFVILNAGHNTKALAIAYMPGIIGGVVLAYSRKKFLGAIILALFLALQVRANHLQITYYTIMVVLILGVTYLIYAVKENTLKSFIITSALLIAFAFLGIASNATTILLTRDYTEVSMRGESELSMNTDDKTSGLDRSYVTDWSYGIAETFTFLIPNFHGGGTADGMLSENSEIFELFERAQGKARAKKVIKQPFPTYWGPQGTTSGPVYVGAVVILLFVFSMFIVKGKLKWWILIATVLSVFLSWGKYFPFLTNFFLDYVPGYNKFRTVSMILVIAELTIPLIAFIGLHKLIENSNNRKEQLIFLKYSFYIVGGISFFWIIFNGMFNFTHETDTYMQQEIIDALVIDRQSLLRKDAFRSLVFVTLATGILYLFLKNKLKSTYFMLGFGLLILVDMWPIDKRYVNNNDFVSKKQATNPFTLTKADEFILQDKDPNYRVLNLTVSTFNNGSTSFFHKSIGGYHGAKLKRYQELIEYHIHQNIQSLAETFNSNPTQMAIDSTLSHLGVLNMLNTRYIIYNAETMPLINRYANGNAWFVDNIQWVETADQEIMGLYDINPYKTAIINTKYSENVESFSPQNDSLAQIVLMDYRPNHLSYQYSSATPQFAVFSEIYYAKGWQAYIDGNPAPHVQTNYVLRGMVVPKGDHTIDFKFEPKSYNMGNKISLTSSAVLIILLLIILGSELYKFSKDTSKETEKS